MGFTRLALALPQASQGDGRAQLPAFGMLCLRHVDGLLVGLFSSLALGAFLPEQDVSLDAVDLCFMGMLKPSVDLRPALGHQRQGAFAVSMPAVQLGQLGSPPRHRDFASNVSPVSKTTRELLDPRSYLPPLAPPPPAKH